MTPPADSPARRKGRPLLALALILLVPLLLGSLAAPAVYRALPAINTWVNSDSLQNPPFERVASRCVQIVALLMIVPAIRLAALQGHLGRSLAPGPGRLRDTLNGWLLGCLSMGALYAIGLLIGAYLPSAKVAGLGVALSRMLGFLVGALLVGLFEETFFRGFLFGAARSRTGFWTAALLTSAFFSAVHFMRPDAPDTGTSPSWSAGLALIPHLFGQFNPQKDWRFMSTLFLMGIALCGYVERKRCLHFAIGLHAGWVWVMLTAAFLLDRNKGFHDMLFSRGDLVSKGALALLVVAPFAWFATRKAGRASA